MKLNKVLALALSGVMAVSMLAGCSNNSGNGGQNGEEQPPVVDTTIAGAVNDKLDDDSVVTFTYSTEVEEAAKQVARVYGGLTQDLVDTITKDEPSAKDALKNYLNIEEMAALSSLGNNQKTLVAGTQTAISVKAYKDLTADGAKKQAAEAFANWVNNAKLEDEKTDDASNLKYSFNYTGDIAMISADDEGHPVYVVIAVVECETAAPVKAE